MVGSTEVFIDLDNRNFYWKSSNWTKFIILKFFFSSAISPEQNFPLVITLSPAKTILAQFPPVSLRAGKRLFIPQCHVIIHVNDPFCLRFPSSLSQHWRPTFPLQSPSIFLAFCISQFYFCSGMVSCLSHGLCLIFFTFPDFN